MNTVRVARVADLFDLLAVNRDGMTLDQISEGLSVSLDAVRTAVRDLRLMFKKDAENVVCEPIKARGQWVYRLTGDYEATRFWAANRIRDTESRLETQAAVAKSVERMTDGRSVAGRKARKIARTLEYLAVELAEIV